MRKIIVDPESTANKERWTGIFLRAKMESADMSGYINQEIYHAKQKKWTRFEQRWFVVDDGRFEIYKTASDVAEGRFSSIVPLSICTIMEEPKSKRKAAPFCFRIDISDPTQYVVPRSIGRIPSKLTLNSAFG
jgi:hypothetical protein